MHHPASLAQVNDALELWGEAPSVRLTFLVDTGARHSLVVQDAMDSLQIAPVGYVDVEAAAVVLHDCPTYRVALRIRVANGVEVLPTSVIGLPAGRMLSRESAPFRGILGRSSLQNTRFMYDGAAGTFGIELVTPGDPR